MLVNEIELNFINNIMKDNLLYLKTKVKLETLNDPIAKTMFFEIGKAMSTYGQLVPQKHLSALINDEGRISNYNKLNYPLELTSVSNLLEYIDKFDTDIKFSTLEKTISEEYIRKKMKVIAENMNDDVYDSKKSVKDIMRKYSYSIDTLKYDNDETIQFVSVEDIVTEEKKRLQSKEKVKYVKTGFNFIDDIAGGVTSPSTIYLVAPSSVGKSIWLYDATVRALRSGKKVLFATVEIPTEEAYLKILSNFAGIKYHTILKKDFTPEELDQYIKALEEFEQYKDSLYLIYDETGLSPDDIKHYYKQLEKCGIICDFIAIDYLGLMRSNDDTHGENERYALLPKQVRILSQETNSIIYIPHQLKTQKSTSDIDDLNPADIYFAMPLMHESTLAYFMTRNKEEGDLTFVRNFKSRIGESKGTYTFRNADRNYINLGKDELYSGNAW